MLFEFYFGALRKELKEMPGKVDDDDLWLGRLHRREAELFCIKKRRMRRGIRSLECNKLVMESRSGDCSCVVRQRKSETLRNRSVQNE